MPRIQTIEELRAKGVRLKNVHLSASTSFSDEEIGALDSILTTLLRGGDARKIASGSAVQRLARKMPTMKAAIERQKARRAAL